MFEVYHWLWTLNNCKMAGKFRFWCRIRFEGQGTMGKLLNSELSSHLSAKLSKTTQKFHTKTNSQLCILKENSLHTLKYQFVLCLIYFYNKILQKTKNTQRKQYNLVFFWMNDKYNSLFFGGPPQCPTKLFFTFFVSIFCQVFFFCEFFVLI